MLIQVTKKKKVTKAKRKKYYRLKMQTKIIKRRLKCPTTFIIQLNQLPKLTSSIQSIQTSSRIHCLMYITRPSQVLKLPYRPHSTQTRLSRCNRRRLILKLKALTTTRLQRALCRSQYSKQNNFPPIHEASTTS